MIWNHNQRLAIFLAAIVSLTSACDTVKENTAASPADASPRSGAETPDADTESEGTANGVVESDRPVVAETLPYADVGDQLVYGHFAFPADMVDPLPGVIVIHERWGLDDRVRAQADRIAAQGYVVLAVDLFHGEQAADLAAARPLMVEVLENPELANENIRQAYQFLIDSGQAPKIAALGWSFGGGWALNTALLFPDDLDAAIIYYGQVTDNHDRLRLLNVPVLGLFGENDRGVTLDSVRQFEAAMEFLGKDYEVEIFPGVGHGFADPGAPTYNAEAAEQAWVLVTDFLSRHLLEDAK